MKLTNTNTSDLSSRVIELPTSLNTKPSNNNNNNNSNPTSTSQEQPRSVLSCFYWALTRKKPLDRRTETNLNRCLGLLDLTTLGVGSTLGLGLYVLAGNVASTKAGPAVIISFAFAALASAFSALCYAEFAGLVPRAGSAYVYSYITVGEFAAFFIGWNLILEYAIGAAAVTRGFSDHIRTLYKHLTTHEPASIIGHHAIDQQFLNRTSIGNNLTSATMDHLDIFGLNATAEQKLGCRLETKESVVTFDAIPFVIVAIITIPIAIGAKCSTRVTFIFTAINLMVVACVLISGISAIDGLKNWQLPAESVHGFGSGGFMPYGWAGVFAGASTCFFGFIGFDTIASSAEEAQNPKRNVPLSIIISLIISSLAYMSIATVQTLVWPYYDQQCETVLPYIFKGLRMPITYWVVTIGALAGLASSQLAGMIPLPRTLYSMANDRLIYSFLSKISERFKIPLRAVIIGSILVAPLAATVETDTLANMVSIGTLAAYTVVSLSVLILRYEQHKESVDDESIVRNHINFVDIFNTLDTIETIPPTKGAVDTIITSTPMKNISTSKINGLNSTGKHDDDDVEINLKLKRTRLLKPQLSAGFQSWFKTSTDGVTNLNPIPEGQVKQDFSNSRLQHQASSSTSISNGQKQIDHQKTITMSRLIYDLMTIDPRSPKMASDPTSETCKLSKILIAILVILCFALDVIAYFCVNSKSNVKTIATTSLGTTTNVVVTSSINLVAGGCIIIVLMATVMVLLSRLPTNTRSDRESFRVPLLPFIPTLSILVNIYLMLSLDALVWVRFMAWMAIGFFIYFSYGIWESIGFLVSDIGLH